MDKLYNLLISILSRAFNGYWHDKDGSHKCGWHLDGDSLAYFMCNYTLQGCDIIRLKVSGDVDLFERLLSNHGIFKSSDGFHFPSGMKLIVGQVKNIGDVIEEYPRDYDRMTLKFPVNIGAVLDDFRLDWSETTKRIPKPEPKYCFFDPERRKNGYDFLNKMLECGEKIGIKDKMFIGFGGSLGYALGADFLPNDDDIDICILADDIPQEQRHQYLMECKNAGLCDNRMRGPVSIEGKYCWFSIGPKSPYTEHGVKSCNWFWFKHGGFWWHSKGAKWIGRQSLSDKYPTAKGIPCSVFDGELKTVKFGEVTAQVPNRLGSCLDWWYPGWVKREKGASKINAVLVIENENDRRTWYVENK